MDKRYFKELSKVQILNEVDIAAELEKAKHGDKKAIKKIVESNLRLVTHHALKYEAMILNNDLLEIGDLIGAGNVGLMKSISRYDNTKNTKFSTYASIWIRSEISKTIKLYSSVIDIEFDENEFLVNDNEIDDSIEKLRSTILRLSPTEQKVIREYFGIGVTKRTLEDIGNDLKVSKQRVWEIKQNIINKLKITLGK